MRNVDWDNQSKIAMQAALKATPFIGDQAIRGYHKVLCEKLPNIITQAGSTEALTADELERMTLTIWSHLHGVAVGAIREMTGYDVPLNAVDVPEKIKALALKHNTDLKAFLK